MADAALGALQNLLTPELGVWLLVGVAVGLFVGVVPGLGGLVGMTILLPFIFGMEPVAGLFLLVGVIAVTQTSDSIPSILFGIPGTAVSQATIMDGHPLARKGEAGRALGAAFSASMVGGLIGAVALLLVIPVARPIVLALASPELLMLTLIGVTTIAIVARGSVLYGLLSGILGLALASIGTPPTVIERRFTFDVRALDRGVSLVVLALGLFALPELFKLLIEKRSVAEKISESKGLLAGIRDTFVHIGLVVRSSLIAVVVGIIPGIGGSAVQWILYGIASNSKKNRVPFGEGEIRGVIAPEAGNNAVDGGALIPAFLFGIPGSAATAVMLGALALLGVATGPRMVEGDGLVLLLSVVWAFAAANVIATLVCLSLTNWLARLTLVPGMVLAPFLMIIAVLGSYQASRHWANIMILLGAGLMGWLMVVIRMPRPPLLIGFVLGVSVERYLWISMSRYGVEWLTRPGVMILAGILFALLIWSIRNQRRSGYSGILDVGVAAEGGAEARPYDHGVRSATFGVMALVFGGMILQANGFKEVARWFPQYVGAAGFIVAIIGLAPLVMRFLRYRRRGDRPRPITGGEGPDDPDLSDSAVKPVNDTRRLALLRSGLGWLGFVAGYVLLVAVGGFTVGSIVMLLMWFGLIYRIKVWQMGISVVAVSGFLWMAQEWLGMSLPPGLI